MISEPPADLAKELAAARLAMSDAAQCAALLTRLNGVRSWVESAVLAVTQRLNQLAMESPEVFPEQIVADATRVSLIQAGEPLRRADAVALLPGFGAALAEGAVNVDHVEVLARSVAGLDQATKDTLAERDGFLTEVASRTTSAQFARTLRDEIRRARADDGIDRLQRQRNNTRLRTWVDLATGMWCLHGEFDPETGAILDTRLHAAVEALYHDATPDTCPPDPTAKQQHLRALALLAITTGNRSGASGGAAMVDMTVLVDATTLVDGAVHDRTVIDCGPGIDLPIETVRRMACTANLTPVIVAADGVHLELGRTTRLANRAQRRALRAMYRGCAIPGCTVSWDHVVIHHLTYYRNGGATDIDNLLPLCSKHHHLAHEGRWQLTLDTDRNLTIVRPDNTRMTTGPPTVWAA